MVVKLPKNVISHSRPMSSALIFRYVYDFHIRLITNVIIVAINGSDGDIPNNYLVSNI